MSEFRVATEHDIVFIARLLREFYQKSGGVYGIHFDIESTMFTIEEVITRGVCLVGKSSCAGAMLTQFPFNNAFTVAAVTFWYFKQPKEIRIFDALVSVCADRGASHVWSSSHFPTNTIGRFYEKRGMRPTEVVYAGQIKACVLTPIG